MIEELDLLANAAGKAGERKGDAPKRAKFEASIIATYNAYLPFYEEVILRRLVALGCQHNVLLLDCGNLLQSLSTTTARPRLAGRAYTLVPMRAASAFHPKIALLVGKKGARLFVGSHNVTLSGFGHNRELTTQIDLPNGGDDPDAALAQAAWKYMDTWLLHQRDRLPESVLESARLVATNFATWLKKNTDDSGSVQFVGAEPEGPSLWARVRPMLPEKARRVIVSGPFFDRAGEFLRTLSQDLQTRELIVGVDPDTVELCDHEISLAGVRFVNASSLGRGSGYLHAKAIWVEGEAGNSILITGSANPSKAAWLEGPAKRNAEAVLVHHETAALNLAQSLGIASIPAMPELGNDVLRAIAERVARTSFVSQPSSSSPVIIAEALEREIVLQWPGLSMQQLKLVRCWDQIYGDWKHSDETSYDGSKLHIMFPPDVVLRIGFIEVELADGHVLHSFVHHPALIAGLSRTSTQQRFRAALDSLDSESPDLPTVIRLAENLIFDSDGFQLKPGPKASGKTGNDEEGSAVTPLGSLSVSVDETRQTRKRARELRGGDLAYLIDVLIYRLGVGLKNPGEQLESATPSEEEQIGADEDPKEPLTHPQSDLVKVCQGKVRTLVGRMLKHFEMVPKDAEQAHRPVDQLLAVLAVIRELRAQDGRLSDLIGGQSLVPEGQRKRLLDGALSALFGRERKLFEVASTVFKDDPEKDLSRLLGLLLWMAWDSGLDVRAGDQLTAWESDQRRERLLELARLLEIAIAAGRDEEVFLEAERSIWRTASEGSRGAASSWVGYHRAWSRALTDLKDSQNVWRRDYSPRFGTLGLAVNEAQKKIRVVLGVSGGSVVLAELGEHREDDTVPNEKKDQVQFQAGFVDIAEFPRITH